MKKQAFTLIELLIVIAIVAILAGAMVPIISVSRQGAKVAKILHLIDVLKTACTMYHFDTENYATEWSTVSNPLQHNLSQDDGSSDWKGPYIDHPIADDDNPFEDYINIYPYMADDFDLDGDGSIDKDGVTPGNCLYFSGVPENAGKEINDILDTGIPGDWKDTGKVKWYSAPPIGDSCVYLIGGSKW